MTDGTNQRPAVEPADPQSVRRLHPAQSRDLPDRLPAMTAEEATELRRGGRLRINREPDEPHRARVFGSLTGDTVQVLVDAVEGGETALDLWEIDQVDDDAVRVLATLGPERCTLVACPRWLEMWLLRVRRRSKG